MNLKKFKKSLVSIVLGSSLFLGNGVICQHPKALFTDEFINSEKEKYAHDLEMTKIIKVSNLFSDFRKEPKNKNVSDTLLNACEKNMNKLTNIKPKNRKIKWSCRFILNVSFYLAFLSSVPRRVALLQDTPTTTEELFKKLYETINDAAEQSDIDRLVRTEINSIFEIANYNDKKTLTDLYNNVINLLNSEGTTAPSSSTSYCTHNTHQDAFITKTLEKLDVD